MNLIIEKTGVKSHQVSLVISCSDSEHEIIIPVIEQFLYDYVSFLGDIKRDGKKNFFRVYLFINQHNGLDFVIRKGALYIQENRKESLIGDVREVVEKSIQSLKDLLSNFPWEDYSLDKEEEISSINQLILQNKI